MDEYDDEFEETPQSSESDDEFQSTKKRKNNQRSAPVTVYVKPKGIKLGIPRRNIGYAPSSGLSLKKNLPPLRVPMKPINSQTPGTFGCTPFKVPSFVRKIPNCGK